MARVDYRGAPLVREWQMGEAKANERGKRIIKMNPCQGGQGTICMKQRLISGMKYYRETEKNHSEGMRYGD